MAASFTIYRSTTLGKALDESLKELEAQNEIREELSQKVMESFDTVICQKFKEMNTNYKCKLQGKCTNYNNCDDVWRFLLNKCQIKGETFQEQSDHCRIVALDAANNPIDGYERKVPAKKPKKNSELGKRTFNRR